MKMKTIYKQNEVVIVCQYPYLVDIDLILKILNGILVLGFTTVIAVNAKVIIETLIYILGK